MASTAANLPGAAQASLRRLGQSSVGLYQIHWPGFPFINNWATEAFVEGLATVQQAGLAKVGVRAPHARSNCSACLCASRSVPLLCGLSLASSVRSLTPFCGSLYYFYLHIIQAVAAPHALSYPSGDSPLD